MKNRIPKGDQTDVQITGKFATTPTTVDDLVGQLTDGSYTADLQYSGDPTQAGTPYNVGNVLPDDVAAALGDTSDDPTLATTLALLGSMIEVDAENDQFLIKNDVTVDGKVHSKGGEQFTFVVDSNDALAAWANNTAGNDYTSVLIMPGTWTSANGVNLTTAGTKVVYGMPGSKLSLTSQYGLRYTSRPSTNDYGVEGVNVTGSNYDFYRCTNLTNCTGTGSNYGFYNCTNLTNCTGTGSNYGFYTCENLTNCTGNEFYTCLNLTNCTGTGSNYSFYNCESLTNCIGNDFYSCTNLTNCFGNSSNYSFHSCTNLTNCSGSSTSSNHNYGFYTCMNLTNCSGYAYSEAIGTAFYRCENLTNCTGIGESYSSSGYGFLLCMNLTNCTGTGIGGYGAGFNQCKGMILNKPGSASTASTYYSCFVLASGTGSVPAATAEGGWNIVNVLT
jgi:hypothetical protein